MANTILVETSARHVHLSEDHIKVLFGENATLKNVILDKDVVVRPGATLIGTESNPIIVKKGEIV